MNQKDKRISQSFQRWLLVLVIIAFRTTIAFLWVFQTKLSENNVIDLLTLNIEDVRQDIVDASDDILLSLTHLIANVISFLDDVDSDVLISQAEKFNVSEINLVDENGIITATTNSGFIGFDMSSGEQNAEFMVLLEGEEEYVQSYQPISYDDSISRKYAGVALKDGGFIQVGYDSVRFQQDIASEVIGVTKNRHVGSGGFIIIADENWNILSNRNGNWGQNLSVTGIVIYKKSMPSKEFFTATVYDEPCYCMYVMSEGHYVVAVMPQSKAVLSRNVSVGINSDHGDHSFCSAVYPYLFPHKKTDSRQYPAHQRFPFSDNRRRP